MYATLRMLVCLSSIWFYPFIHLYTGPISVIPQDTNTNNVNDDNPLASTSSATDMEGKELYECPPQAIRKIVLYV